VTISYAEFGERFFDHAVTTERVEAGLAELAGDPIEFGPIGAGPGKVVQVRARGTVAAGRAERRAVGEFRLHIPVDLKLRIDIGPDRHRFDVHVLVGLDLHARAADPLRVLIEVDPPGSDDVEVRMESRALRSSVLQRVAGIDREIAKFVARYVTKELDKPHIKEAREFDVAARLDSAI
jgi:hypothetical protein